jgi:hypothetical protein
MDKLVFRLDAPTGRQTGGLSQRTSQASRASTRGQPAVRRRDQELSPTPPQMQEAFDRQARPLQHDRGDQPTLSDFSLISIQALTAPPRRSSSRLGRRRCLRHHRCRHLYFIRDYSLRPRSSLNSSDRAYPTTPLCQDILRASETSATQLCPAILRARTATTHRLSSANRQHGSQHSEISEGQRAKHIATSAPWRWPCITASLRIIVSRAARRKQTNCSQA